MRSLFLKAPPKYTFFFEKIRWESGRFVYQGDPPAMKDVLAAVFTVADQYPMIFADLARRIFDQNAIANESEAAKGLLGRFNRKEQKRRKARYLKKISRGFRADPENIVILAEGDSWFQYPRLFGLLEPVKDIVDWLIEDKLYAVYSLAYGGDWLSNIFYLGEYIEILFAGPQPGAGQEVPEYADHHSWI